MAKDTAPDNLYELFTKVIKAAKEFGFIEGKNGLLRDCISNNSKTGIRSLSDKEANFWFGFIREDQPTGGPYDGLSYVIFPEHDGARCLVAIGIGSSSIGKDGDLAANPGFRRSFMRLNKANTCNAKFFY